MPTFQRPNSPYDNQPGHFSNWFRQIAATFKTGVPAIYFDDMANYTIDSLNDLQVQINGVTAGIIPGSNVPTNDKKVLTCDANNEANHTPWNFITNENLEELCIAGKNIQPSAVNGEIHILENSIPSNAISGLDGSKITDNTLPGSALADNQNISVHDLNVGRNLDVVGSADIGGGAEIIGNVAITGNITGATWQGALIATTYLKTPSAYALIAGGANTDSGLQGAGTGTIGQFYVSRGNTQLGQWRNLQTSDLPNNCVTTPKISDGAVTLNKIGNDVPLISASADIASNGNINGAYNVSCNRTGVGTYQITFNTNMSNSYYGLSINAIFDYDLIAGYICSVTNKNSSGFTVKILRISNGAPTDVRFTFLVSDTNV